MIQFSPETLVLTANRRLAETIRQDYNRQQQHEQRLVWNTAEALPLNTWLKTLWQSHPLGIELVLSNHQEQQLWSQIIKATSLSAYPLLHLDNTAQLVQQAWGLLKNWQVSLQQVKDQAVTAETELFVDWVEKFIAQCQQQGWVSEAELAERLQMIMIKHPVPLPKQIIIAGFDELSPAYQRLVNIIQQFTSVTLCKVTSDGSQYHQAIFTDLEMEIRAMAQWAKVQIEKNPQAKVGCVAPQLTQHRNTIMHIFNQVFAPENQLPGVTPSPTPFNISAGQSLREFELIETGLQILRLDIEKLALDSLGLILQSPYICQNDIDINLGAMLDAACRQLGGFELPLSALFTAITQWHINYPGNTWLARWRAFAAVNLPASIKQLPSEWASHFIHQLSALGWPGGRNLNSLEYQVISRWQELLTEFAELNLITGPVARGEALHALQRLTGQTIFQPKTDYYSPIQILGVLESSGLHFDSLWVMGLDDQNWPPSTQPNPFLPYSLQIQRQMPHSSPQREFLYAQQILQRLLNSATLTWLSCSAKEADQPARFNRCLAKISPTFFLEPSGHVEISHYAEKIFASAQTENIHDDYGPPIAANIKIRGGSGILTKQAECPFRAFATYRLNASALAEPELGVSAKIHGVIIHNVMERLWKILQNQQNLLAVNPDQLEPLINNTIAEVIQDELPQPESTFAQIEKQRAHTIISEWLSLEKQRPPFQVIEQETERAIELAGLNLNLKIDRIDQLTNGSQLLIDYKTGDSSVHAWLNPRLQQPQLPLYAIDPYQQNHFAGIAFAQLRIGKLSFKGLHAEGMETSHYFPTGIIRIDAYKNLDAPKTWTELLAHWRQILLKLGTDFYNGYAAVDPADNRTPCQQCDLQVLCRIHSRERL